MTDKLISFGGNLAAVAGTAVCVLTVLARIFGIYDVAGLGTMALFTVGVGMMVFACLAKLHWLTLHAARRS
jgi:hypothetical protein